MAHKSGNTTWKDYPSAETPITAARLNNIENYIDTLGDLASNERRFYVSPNGSDDNDGLSSDRPLRHIYKALNLVSAVSKVRRYVNIYVEGGEYSGDYIEATGIWATIILNGNVSINVLEGRNACDVTDGRLEIKSGNNSKYSINFYGGVYGISCTVNGFLNINTITEFAFHAIKNAAISIRYGAHVSISNTVDAFWASFASSYANGTAVYVTRNGYFECTCTKIHFSNTVSMNYAFLVNVGSYATIANAEINSSFNYGFSAGTFGNISLSNITNSAKTKTYTSGGGQIV